MNFLSIPPDNLIGGKLMIREIDIRNYKCFEHLHIPDCRRVNVIVGENGSGKTALLEAMFMALGCTSQLVMRFRQIRGLDITFRGGTRVIEEALWRDYFHNLDMSRSISVNLVGDGPEARSVRIDRGQGEVLFSLETESPSSAISAIQFEWTNQIGNKHQVAPTISAEGIRFPETGEDLPDFFFFAANQTYSSAENADRFSSMSKAKRAEFSKVFTSEYNWLEDLSVESSAGSPALYARVKGVDDVLPITSVSGGINRIIAVLLAMASRKRSVVMFDEAENGLYYSRYAAFWNAILHFSRTCNSQVFLTTHSDEWLRALASVFKEKLDDVAIWRTERIDNVSGVQQFKGKQVRLGIRAGEMR